MGKIKPESKFQANLKKEIKRQLPNCMIMKLNETQGYPDLLILNGERWGTLECKKYGTAPHRPNQDHYVDRMNNMSFSSFIYPENKEEVLNELYKTLQP